jgi:hypothetical protein
MRVGWSIIIVPAAALLASCSTPGCQPVGDPENRVLDRPHSAMTAAIPSGVQVKSFKSYPTHFHTKCPDNPSGRDGWDAVRVQAWFTTRESRSAFASTVNAVMVRSGWTRRDVESSVFLYGDDHAVQQEIPEWTKAAPTGSDLTLSLYPVDSGPRDLALEARWDPPGFNLPGC